MDVLVHSFISRRGDLGVFSWFVFFVFLSTHCVLTVTRPKICPCSYLLQVAIYARNSQYSETHKLEDCPLCSTLKSCGIEWPDQFFLGKKQTAVVIVQLYFAESREEVMMSISLNHCICFPPGSQTALYPSLLWDWQTMYHFFGQLQKNWSLRCIYQLFSFPPKEKLRAGIF